MGARLLTALAVVYLAALTVVYVYTGLRRPDAMKYRELLRRDFEARFGVGAPGRALEPDVLRQIFRTDPN